MIDTHRKLAVDRIGQDCTTPGGREGYFYVTCLVYV